MFTLQLLLQSSDTDVTCNKEQYCYHMLLETKTNKQRPAASNTRQDFKEFADEFDDQHCRHSRSNFMAFLGVFHYYLSMLALQ
jgi:hypothetical protein